MFVAVALWLALPGTAAAVVPAGFDLFETDPATTVFDYSKQPIPQDFFGQGSDPFNQPVNFGGVPLEDFGGHMVGDADTVVQRLNDADPMPNAQVGIELVQLNLVSIEPITVVFNNRTERWEVRAMPSPTQPSTGQMFINQESEQGGTFDSFFDVFPLFEFTRIPDGQMRELDANFLDPNQVEFFAQDVPWRTGCAPPALAVEGLNDGFCPGQEVDGQKRLTIEQSQLAAHGVYPAQPALEHFKCYELERKWFEKSFEKQDVTLTDQFGTRNAKVRARAELCNPVQKNNEPFENKPAHLQCYTAPGPKVNKLVAVQNQLGSQRLLVEDPETLCLPTKKRLVTKKPKPFKPIKVPIDHYQCYDVEPQTELYRVGKVGKFTLKDQFGTEKKVELLDPVQLCAPVQKTSKDGTFSIQHPVKHLVCYEIEDDKLHADVEVRNQFEQQKLTTREPVSLCVPSNKLVVQ